MLGEIFGNYRVTSRIGAGGMGEVYRAEHTMLGKQAALKVLLPIYAGNEQLVARFFNEARAASQIRHPGIVEILDFGHRDGSAYILMEYLQGEPLKERLRRAPRMAPDVALRSARQIASVLAATHREGIVHRDLKPDNIFVVPDPEVHGGERIKTTSSRDKKTDKAGKPPEDELRRAAHWMRQRAWSEQSLLVEEQP